MRRQLGTAGRFPIRRYPERVCPRQRCVQTFDTFYRNDPTTKASALSYIPEIPLERRVYQPELPVFVPSLLRPISHLTLSNYLFRLAVQSITTDIGINADFSCVLIKNR